MKKYFNQVENFFNKSEKANIIVFGDVMLDAYLIGKVDRISPEAPVPVVNLLEKKESLGGAANVALNIKKLGAEPILFSVIGNDENAKILEKIFKKNNLSLKGIIKSTSRITTTKYRIVSNKMQLLRVDDEKIEDIDIETENKLFNLFCKTVQTQKPKAIILQDYNKGILTKSLIKKIIDLANKLEIPVTVDPKKTNFQYYKNVNLFKPNLKELSEGLNININPNSLESLKEAAFKLHTKLNVKNILITLSDKGIFISKFLNKKQIVNHFPAVPRNITDVSGAGDTVISVATLGIVAEIDLEILGIISNIAGGFVCEKSGVIAITKEELKSELFDNKRLDFFGIK